MIQTKLPPPGRLLRFFTGAFLCIGVVVLLVGAALDVGRYSQMGAFLILIGVMINAWHLLNFSQKGEKSLLCRILDVFEDFFGVHYYVKGGSHFYPPGRFPSRMTGFLLFSGIGLSLAGVAAGADRFLWAGVLLIIGGVLTNRRRLLRHRKCGRKSCR